MQPQKTDMPDAENERSRRHRNGAKPARGNTFTSSRRRRGWISRGVSNSGVQARLCIAGEEVSKWFTIAEYGGRQAAERAAQAWIDLLADDLPSKCACGLRNRVSPSKRDKSLPVGISESRYELRSGNTGTRFQVLWHDGTHPRMKSFTIGPDDVATEADRRAALRRATTFRCRYETARKEGRPFKPDAV